MADERVGILVEVTARGKEELAQVSDGIRTLGGQTDAAAGQTDKAQKLSGIWTQRLSGQIPIVRNLNPLLSSMGLGAFAGATAFGAATVAITQAVKAYSEWKEAITAAAVSTNLFTSTTQSAVDTQKDLAEIGKSLSLAGARYSTKDLAKELAALNQVTRSEAESLTLLYHAGRAAYQSGAKLSEVTAQLTQAYEQGITGKAGEKLMGAEALTYILEQYAAVEPKGRGVPYMHPSLWQQLTGWKPPEVVPYRPTNIPYSGGQPQIINVYIGNELVTSHVVDSLNTNISLQGIGE